MYIKHYVANSFINIDRSLSEPIFTSQSFHANRVVVIRSSPVLVLTFEVPASDDRFLRRPRGHSRVSALRMRLEVDWPAEEVSVRAQLRQCWSKPLSLCDESKHESRGLHAPQFESGRVRASADSATPPTRASNASARRADAPSHLVRFTILHSKLYIKSYLRVR
jgi:hypothetical protein